MALVGPRQCGKTTLAREFVAFDSLDYKNETGLLVSLDIPKSVLTDKQWIEFNEQLDVPSVDMDKLKNWLLSPSVFADAKK